MRKIWQVATFSVLAFCALGLHAADPSQSQLGINAVVGSGSRLVLQRVEKLQHEIKSTRYSHKTEIDKTRGSYNVDCSGLARFILRETVPEALQVLPHEPGFSFPRAVCFYSAFTNSEDARVTAHWRQIKRMTDIEPGDFIAWRKIEIKKGDNSGHVLIALEKPRRESDGSFRVKLFDSSGGNHSDDSRAKGETGIGTGVMWFNVNATDQPIAFRWGASSKPKPCPLSMARVR